MAEGDGSVYNEFKFRVLNGSFNLAVAQDTIKVALLTGHSLDIDADTAWASVSADECSGTGYTSGGETLANQATSKDTTNDRGVFDGDDVAWTGLDVSGGGDPNYAVIYSVTASNYLIAAWEIATGTNGGNWTLEWSTSPAAIVYIG